MILLKDGVRYFLHSYGSEEELEKMVIEHYKEIFGEHSLYFDKETMKTKAGIEAKNDGVIISLDENKWFVLEAEFHHDPYQHITPQITKFFNAYKSYETRKKIINTLYQTIESDTSKKVWFQLTIHSLDVYKFLTDLIDSQPTIAIVIDSKTDVLDEVCKSLPFPTIVKEFKTFVRENVGLGMHIHLFEPLFMEKPPSKEEKVKPLVEVKMPIALEQTLKVTKLIHQGKSFKEAVKTVAEEHKVGYSTISSACTGHGQISTDGFIEKVKNKSNLTSYLQERFTKYVDLINTEIENIYKA